MSQPGTITPGDATASERKALAASWHAGEREMQRRAGVEAVLAGLAPRVYRDQLSDAQQAFFQRLTYLIAGSVDATGSVWASVLEGPAGFVAAKSPSDLAVTNTRDPSDPADAGLNDGDSVGLLGIDLSMRRRLRINGRVRRQSADHFTVQIEQGFGNCPKYIQARDAFPSVFAPPP